MWCWRSHQVKRGGLSQSTLRQPRLAEGIVFVGVHQGEDDEERVMRVLQTRSTDQLRGETLIRFIGLAVYLLN